MKQLFVRRYLYLSSLRNLCVQRDRFNLDLVIMKFMFDNLCV